MKKFLMIAIIAAMCFALSACGSEEATEEVVEDQSLAEDIELGTALGAFASTDLEGNEVTEAIFTDKDVTILNVWGTFCEPCKSEMPDLSELDSELPDNAQIIGVVIDVPEGDTDMIETAKAICKDTDVTFTNIIMNESMEEMMGGVEAVPTTFILDRDGKTVCTPFIGTDVEGYRAAALEYLETIK